VNKSKKYVATIEYEVKHTQHHSPNLVTERREVNKHSIAACDCFQGPVTIKRVTVKVAK
jgi:hypothetical protein